MRSSSGLVEVTRSSWIQLRAVGIFCFMFRARLSRPKLDRRVKFIAPQGLPISFKCGFMFLNLTFLGETASKRHLSERSELWRFGLSLVNDERKTSSR